MLLPEVLPFPWYVINRINSFLITADIKNEPQGPVVKQEPKEDGKRPSGQKTRKTEPKQVHRFKGRYGGQRRDAATQIQYLQRSGTQTTMVDETGFTRVCKDVLREISEDAQQIWSIPAKRLRKKCRGQVKRHRLRGKTTPPITDFKITRAATEVLHFAAESFLTGRLVKAACLARMAKCKTVDIKHTQMVDNLALLDRDPMTSPLISDKKRKRRMAAV